MCRILAVKADAPVDVKPFLEPFTERCKVSKEFQGDGWGMAWRENGEWQSFHTLKPIWDSEVPVLPKSTLFLIHARSAFRNELIRVENNMPFIDGDKVFLFNGELRNVKLQAPGETGAWKLFHLFKNFTNAEGGDGFRALKRLDQVVAQRTEYVRAMNIAATDGRSVWASSRFSEDPDYFTLWTSLCERQGVAVSLLSSERFDVSGEQSCEWWGMSNPGALEWAEDEPC